MGGINFSGANYLYLMTSTNDLKLVYNIEILLLIGSSPFNDYIYFYRLRRL